MKGRNLGSVGKQRGPQGLHSGPRVPRSGEGGGGPRGLRSGKTPRGVRHGVDGEVESPQGADTPGVAEGPRRDKTLGAPTAAQGGTGEDGQGRGGGDENPPTARATRMQGDDGNDGKPMVRKADGGAARHGGDGRGKRQRGALERAIRRPRRRHVQARRACASRVGLTGVGGNIGGSSQRGGRKRQGRPWGLGKLGGYRDGGGRNPTARAPHTRIQRRRERGDGTP